MELNGIANMLAIISMAEESSQIDATVAAELRDQLNVMERYLVAVSDCNRSGKQIPFWHDVRDNRTMYRTNSQRGT